MLKKELKTHSLVAFIYFAAITFFNLKLKFNLLFLWLGALLGTFLLDIDHFLIAFDPENKTWWAEKFRYLWRRRSYKKATLQLIDTHLDHRHLVFHSVVFQPILLILALFILSSTGSLFGYGLIMGLNLHLLKDEWQCLLEDGHFSWVFWQLKRKIDVKTQKIYLLGATSFFFLLTLFLI